MLRVVVDTNVIVSALLKAESDPALIVSLIFNQEIEVCLSDEIYREYREVLARGQIQAVRPGERKETFTRDKNPCRLGQT